MKLNRRLARALITLGLISLGLISACSKSAEETDSNKASRAVPAITGVTECDEFLADYEQCLMEKIPAEVSAQLSPGIEQWKSAWKSMTEDVDARAALPTVCRQTRDASAPTLRAYGCAL